MTSQEDAQEPEIVSNLRGNWRIVAEFFVSRNWPDTALGHAANHIHCDMPKILARLTVADTQAAENGAKDAEIARLNKKLAWQEECQQNEFEQGLKRAEAAESLAQAERRRADDALEEAARWKWARPILAGDDEPLANARTLELAAGLMRNETPEQTIDNAIRALKTKGAT